MRSRTRASAWIFDSLLGTWRPNAAATGPTPEKHLDRPVGARSTAPRRWARQIWWLGLVAPSRLGRDPGTGRVPEPQQKIRLVLPLAKKRFSDLTGEGLELGVEGRTL